jgi:hypothetical protein
MRVRLEYGKTGLEVELPDDRVVGPLAIKLAPPLPDAVAVLRQKLARPTGTPALAELARGRKSACIAICDITRPVPNELILRPLLATLEKAGIPRDKITIVPNGHEHVERWRARIETITPAVSFSTTIEIGIKVRSSNSLWTARNAFITSPLPTRCPR